MENSGQPNIEELIVENAALVTALEAVQKENKLLHERHHFDNVAYTEAQKDVGRYRWLKDSSGREWVEQYYGAFMVGNLDDALDANKDAAIKAQGEANETA